MNENVGASLSADSRLAASAELADRFGWFVDGLRKVARRVNVALFSTTKRSSQP